MSIGGGDNPACQFPEISGKWYLRLSQPQHDSLTSEVLEMKSLKHSPHTEMSLQVEYDNKTLDF